MGDLYDSYKKLDNALNTPTMSEGYPNHKSPPMPPPPPVRKVVTHRQIDTKFNHIESDYDWPRTEREEQMQQQFLEYVKKVEKESVRLGIILGTVATIAGVLLGEYLT